MVSAAAFLLENQMGLGPYSLSSPLARQARQIRMMGPTRGSSANSQLQPLLPISCIRRVNRAKPGMRVPKEYALDSNVPNSGNTPVKKLMISVTRILKRNTYQYSLLVARPEKSAYFRKKMAIASPKVTG